MTSSLLISPLLVSPLLIAGAFLLEAAIGWPHRLHRLLPHPVVWIGNLIGALERLWNRPDHSETARRLLGVATLLIAAGCAGLVGFGLQNLARLIPHGWIIMLVGGAFGLAARSLFDHVRAIAVPLMAGDLDAARTAVGWIVGRDTESLDASGIAAAALESLAESFNDGVVAPLFWFVIGGLPGLFAYKAVNTADSMIGHREPRWRAFGWAAARTDDLMNLIPARIAATLIALASGPAIIRAARTMLRDASRHASPNAGWPEAAMAGALGVRLGGPVRYDGLMTHRPDFGDGPAPTAPDLNRGLRVYLIANALLLALLILGGLAWPL